MTAPYISVKMFYWSELITWMNPYSNSSKYVFANDSICYIGHQYLLLLFTIPFPLSIPYHHYFQSIAKLCRLHLLLTARIHGKAYHHSSSGSALISSWPSWYQVCHQVCHQSYSYTDATVTILKFCLFLHLAILHILSFNMYQEVFLGFGV